MPGVSWANPHTTRHRFDYKLMIILNFEYTNLSTRFFMVFNYCNYNYTHKLLGLEERLFESNQLREKLCLFSVIREIIETQVNRTILCPAGKCWKNQFRFCCPALNLWVSSHLFQQFFLLLYFRIPVFVLSFQVNILFIYICLVLYYYYYLPHLLFFQKNACLFIIHKYKYCN